MAFTSTLTATHLDRSQVWSAELKEVLIDQLQAAGYVRWLTDFPEGDTFR